MYGLAREFVAHSARWNIEPNRVGQFLGDSLDLEVLMNEVDRVVDAGPGLDKLGEDPRVTAPASVIRSELEWFVQHAAERMLPDDAATLWQGVMHGTTGTHITFATTNYDRAIEMAARASGVEVEDGFADVSHGEAAAWVGFGGPNTGVRLIKLHGSTDWYRDRRTGAPMKVRHPLALFGDLSLEVGGGQRLGSSLVLPAREKVKGLLPYPRLTQAFLNSADLCDVAIFVGSSLRDEDVREAAATTARRVPTFVVNPTDLADGIVQAHVIRETASRFLVSTLPNALGAADPVESLRLAAAEAEDESAGVLSAVKVLMSDDCAVNDRCRAVHELEAMGVTLDAPRLRKLLTGSSAKVAGHALGLVPGSSGREELLAVAEQSAHRQDAEFSRDLDILRRWDQNG